MEYQLGLIPFKPLHLLQQKWPQKVLAQLLVTVLFFSFSCYLIFAHDEFKNRVYFKKFSILGDD